MQNTWSIGRTWKPREGWSRPVLTDERQHSHSPIRSGTASSSCKRHQTAMSIVWPQDERPTHRVRYPVPRPPQAGRPQRLTVQEKICGGHGPGETPGPIPNPEAKAWHGDGTAPDRVWESSTPPHHTYRKPLGAHAPRGFLAYPKRLRPKPTHPHKNTGGFSHS